MPNRTLHFFRKDLVDSNSKDKDWNQTQKREDVHWTTGGFAMKSCWFRLNQHLNGDFSNDQINKKSNLWL